MDKYLTKKTAAPVVKNVVTNPPVTNTPVTNTQSNVPAAKPEKKDTSTDLERRVDIDFLKELFRKLGQANVEVVLGATKKVQVDLNKFFTSLFDFALDKDTLMAFFYNKYLETPLTKFMQYKELTVRPLAGKDWDTTWEDVRQGSKKIALDALRSFIFKIMTDLLIPFRNQGGGKAKVKGEKKEVKDAEAPKPKKAERDAKFRTDVLARDRNKCIITGVISDSEKGAQGILGPLEAAHIIPHQLASKKQEKLNARQMIEIFAGPDVLKNLPDKVNLVTNGLLLDLNCHKTFDSLQWGIRAEIPEGETKFKYEVVRTRADKRVHAGISESFLEDGKTLTFTGAVVKFPNPVYCNMHLAIAQFSNASGMAEIIDELFDDDMDFSELVLTLVDEEERVEVPVPKQAQVQVREKIPEQAPQPLPGHAFQRMGLDSHQPFIYAGDQNLMQDDYPDLSQNRDQDFAQDGNQDFAQDGGQDFVQDYGEDYYDDSHEHRDYKRAKHTHNHFIETKS